jgi:hypothetical protein
MRMSNECNNAIIRAVAKTYLIINNQVTAIELFDFIKKHRIVSKSNDISSKTIGVILANASHKSANYQIFKKVGSNINDETVWELSQANKWSMFK